MEIFAALTKEQFEALPEQDRGIYAERDGLYHPNVKPMTLKVGDAEATFALENVTGLKKALSTQSARTRDLEKVLKAYEDLDPQQAREAIKKLEEMGSGADDRTKQQIEAVKASLEATHRRELAKKDEESKAVQGELGLVRKQLEKLLIENAAIEAINAEGGIKGAAVKALLPVILSCTRVTKNDKGEFVSQVVDHDGEVRISFKPNCMDNMDIRELVTEMKNGEFAFLFEGTDARGAGASSSGGRSGRMKINAADFSKLPPSEQLKLARAQQSGS